MIKSYKIINGERPQLCFPSYLWDGLKKKVDQVDHVGN